MFQVLELVLLSALLGNNASSFCLSSLVTLLYLDSKSWGEALNPHSFNASIKDNLF